MPETRGHPQQIAFRKAGDMRAALEPREKESTNSRLDYEEPGAISFADLVGLLAAGKRTIVLSGLCALVLSAILSFLIPNSYTSSTSFVPPGSTSSSSSAAAIMGQLSALGGAGSMLASKGQGDLFVGILKSHTIAVDLVHRFDLLHYYKVKKESQAENILAKNSTFTVNTKDPIVVISVVDTSPEHARDLAKGYLEALESTTNHMALTESSQRRAFYESRLAKEKDDLAAAEIALKQNQEKTGLIAPAGQTSSEIQTLAQLRAQISDRQVRLAALLHDEADENPNVLRVRSELSSLENQVSQLESGKSSGQFGRFSTAQVPGLALEYIQASRNVKYHETLFDIIARQYEAARIDEAKDAPLQVLDQASLPDTKSGPHRMLLMAIGLIVGLVGGACWILFKSFGREITNNDYA